VNAERREAFQRSIREALETAQRLGVRRLNVITGIPTSPSSDVRQTLVENFGWASTLAEPTGIYLLVENINDKDMPGFFVNTVERAVDIVKAVGRPNVRLQLDQYHVGMMGGDARAALREYRDLVEHVQIADVPGRHEPGTGQQPIREFLADLDQLGYQGAVGLEYRPGGPTEAALNWLPRERRG
jgi:hydroxypyruvate isomerase